MLAVVDAAESTTTNRAAGTDLSDPDYKTFPAEGLEAPLYEPVEDVMTGVCEYPENIPPSVAQNMPAIYPLRLDASVEEPVLFTGSSVRLNVTVSLLDRFTTPDINVENPVSVPVQPVSATLILDAPNFEVGPDSQSLMMRVGEPVHAAFVIAPKTEAQGKQGLQVNLNGLHGFNGPVASFVSLQVNPQSGISSRLWAILSIVGGLILGSLGLIEKALGIREKLFRSPKSTKQKR